MASAADARLPIAVLFGGPSAEHDVSIVSGTAITDALRSAGHIVDLVLIDLDGGWWWLPPGHRREDGEGPMTAGAALDRLASADPPPVVFIALHGPFGEDGTVQALLETAELAYTGAGVTASAIGMDKAVFKRLTRGLGLPVVEWREVTQARWEADPGGVLAELAAFTAASGEERLMIKPARLGSSVGMTLAHDANERALALQEAFRFDTLAIVERYVPNARDLEVSVIGNDPAAITEFGPGEVIAGHEFYDYAAKYTPGLSETSTHAEVDPRTRALIRKLARDAYRAIGAEGFARVDFLLAPDGLYLSEINTIPGFTPISLFPTMPAEGGLDFLAVCERVVELAVERHERRARGRLRPLDLPR